MDTAIPFNEMPSNLRRTGVYIEISNLLAFKGADEFRVLFIGQRLADGTVAEGVLTRATREDEGDELFGRGSMLAEMLRAGKAVNRYMETYAIALDEDAAGAQATGNISITGTATAAGTLSVYFVGKRVRVAVAAGDTAATITTALIAAITAATDLPVTAAVDGVNNFQTNFTCRWKGETGNTIDVRLNMYDEKTPKGLAVVITAMSGGTSNPDVATAFAAMGPMLFNWMVFPYNDTANITALETKLTSLWGPTQQRGTRAFTAFRGNLAASSTYGSGRNNPHVTCMPTNITPQPAYVIAAINAMAAAGPLSRDPSRSLADTALPGMIPPSNDVRWLPEEWNDLLWAGMSAYDVGMDGVCRINRQITQYQTAPSGLGDVSYLDITRPETLARVRTKQIEMLRNKFITGRFKLSDDETAKFDSSQPVLTKDVFRANMFALYEGELVEHLAWCHHSEKYKASFKEEFDTANNAVYWADEPYLIGQVNVMAGLMQFHT